MGTHVDTALPPGQRAVNYFPRFGVPAYAKRLPEVATGFELQLAGDDGAARAPVRMEELNALPRGEVVADFHCVTTWTRRALAWSGFAFKDFYQGLFLPRVGGHPNCDYLELKALDGYTACILLEDLLQKDVLLADRLEGEPLSLEHGGPIRLLVPHLYAFKSVKHVCSLRPRHDYRRSFAERQTLAHPRGRVALEERGRGLPGAVYRLLYRALLPPTLWYYRRVERERAPTR